MRTARDWYEILVQCQVRPLVAVRWGDVFANVVQPGTFSAGDKDIQAFLGQVLIESARLESLQENLSYSSSRLMQVWPKHFPTLSDAQPYAHNPEALANRVYGGRLGNTAPGDGWKYRGRGLIQLTGKANYATTGKLVGLDLLGNPDLLIQPAHALQVSIKWWEGHIPDSMLSDTSAITRRVNGGQSALAEREKTTAEATKALA
ncbi:MAG: glycoside hydrolase family 19 protein [Patescibacteria group bacterium]|nr:glycoside hydrolase family 19 protein [Patescibacteria group bacterium]